MTHRPFFLYVGRLEKLKGVQDLLRLFEYYRQADLIIAGSGSYAPVLREQARSLPHVKFIGQIHPSSLGDLYRRAIAVLVPSLCYETFGLTAAEALSHGTPAIVRHIGALPEMIDQSGGGYTFSSLEDCRQAMERLRTQPKLRMEMGQRGYEAVKRYWSVEAHLEQYLSLIESLSKQKSGKASIVSQGCSVGAITTR
jgi:glycosyltransferase involved in cell wall biosynthesis